MTQFQATIEKLIFGGNGLVRLEDGMVAFVPFVIPGETIRGKINRKHKSYALAELEEVIEPSPSRIQPKCPHFGICGGCQLQHIQYEAHAAIKAGFLREALSFCDLPPLEWSPSTAIWQWRKKCILHAKREGDEVLLGYYVRNSKTLFSCTECPIFFAPEEKEVIALVKEALSQNKKWKEGDVFFFRRPSGKIGISFFLDTSIESPFVDSSEPTDSTFSFHSIQFEYSEKAFIQTHPEQPFILWQDFIQHMHLWQKESRFLDLYSGIGVTATLAAKAGHQVTAVEIDKEAVHACKRTLEKEKIRSLRPIQAPVEQFLKSKDYTQTNWDVLLINPPRGGLSPEVLQVLSHSKAKEIQYISCHPATLRRDLMAFTQSGWKITWVKGYDMFPQTSHFETYVRLTPRSTKDAV